MRKKILLAIILVLLLSLALVVVVSATPNASYDLSWHVLGAGGGKSTSASGTVLNGTIGQTAVSASSGSGDTLQHGFWQELSGIIRTILPFTVKH